MKVGKFFKVEVSASGNKAGEDGEDKDDFHCVKLIEFKFKIN